MEFLGRMLFFTLPICLFTIQIYGQPINNPLHSKKIILHGINHSGKKVVLSLLEWGKKMDKPKELCSSININDSDLTLHCNLSTPIEGEIIGLGLQNTTVYILPGDSLSFIIDTIPNSINSYNRLKLTFRGKHAGHYNYFSLLGRRSFNSFEILNHNGYDLTQWDQCKHIIDSVAALRERFTRQFFKENPDKKFQPYVSNYLNSLHFIDLVVLVMKNLKNNCRPPENFFKSFSPSFFQNNKMMVSRQNTLALMYMNNYVLNKPPAPGKNEFTTLTLEQRFRTTVKYFKNRPKDFLLYALVEQYAKKQIQTYKPELSKIVNYVNKNMDDKDFLNGINEWDKYYNFSNIPFPDSVLQTLLIDIQGRKLTFEELLNNYKGKVIYIDFWASWCGPCKEEVTLNRFSVNQYEKKGINFIYLSIDRISDSTKWKSIATSLHIRTNNYLIEKVSSTLINYLKVYSIPRFIAIDRKGVLAFYDGPRPSQVEMFKNISDDLLSR